MSFVIAEYLNTDTEKLSDINTDKLLSLVADSQKEITMISIAYAISKL